ncbi:LysR family transcriptional regulator [Hydrogenophaga sp.]|uniref:LysR family transcriptional regulator n=1 Tax=Hydrogenophaga sp. TaxID=1904254 RepID=UPI0027254CD4|nr:LysR family transcriptional regulator [Hydrogenophaga sp.]MDO9435898.1 LysR substrate-binding domain-containing protein [Hydrogenophaga sp.]
MPAARWWSFGSFSEAACDEGIAPSLVAKRIGQLERHLHKKLFDRTTRSVTLTDAGEKFNARAAEVVTQFEELVSKVERDDGKVEGHIRVIAPTTLAIRELGPIFNQFLVEHPRVTLEVVLVDRSANPAEGNFDLAISGRLASYEGVVDIPLRPVRPILCAPPDYLSRAPALSHPRDLSEHACIVFSGTGADWHFVSAKGTVSVEVRPRLVADDNLSVLDAARRGLGVALIPEYVVRQNLESGALVGLLPKFEPQENWFKAFIPRRRLNVARVAALLKWLQERWAHVS